MKIINEKNVETTADFLERLAERHFFLDDFQRYTIYTWHPILSQVGFQDPASTGMF